MTRPTQNDNSISMLNNKEYSLAEVSKRLHIDQNWINNLQRKTGIPKPIGRRGERSYFSDKDMAKIALVYMMRQLGASFDDIKKFNYKSLMNLKEGVFTETINKHIAELQERAKELEAMLASINIEDMLEDMKEKQECEDHISDDKKQNAEK